MTFILELLVSALVLVLLSSSMASVHVKNFTTAILVALVVGLLNATIGFLIRLPFNIITLGLLTFVVRLFVSAIMIKLADKFFRGFEVRGWGAAFIIAACIALSELLLHYIL